jgi:hypothetical protein
MWKWSRHICTKVELIPQTEELVYQKVNIFGQIITKKVKIADL